MLRALYFVQKIERFSITRTLLLRTFHNKETFFMPDTDFEITQSETLHLKYYCIHQEVITKK